ncbi:YggS family pyridoxal phosphate-dependent enzyme [Brevundimonas sp.]|jgi:pyridoxal phosphate enzyme (YggS family)|uniref:YggS family pyridoxal phosphate-dependent enzyme n=1 Tax=Brevundimonas sp. TaxID=1871086 RepID=UPI00378441B8
MPSSPVESPASIWPASIADRLALIDGRIRAAAEACGRDPASVTLTVVSKTQGREAIDAALAAGASVFGENRVQEAQTRWTEERARSADVELRLIGALQSNKAADAVALFDVIETLDRDSLARALATAIQKAGRSPRLLVQVNTGEEPQKAGIIPRDLDAFLNSARDDYGLSVEGLMAIPPVDEAAGLHFALLARLAERNGLKVLSMGMSGDFETAIRFGATHVRVGSAIFGERKSPEAPSRV